MGLHCDDNALNSIQGGGAMRLSPESPKIYEALSESDIIDAYEHLPTEGKYLSQGYFSPNMFAEGVYSMISNQRDWRATFKIPSAMASTTTLIPILWILSEHFAIWHCTEQGIESRNIETMLPCYKRQYNLFGSSKIKSTGIFLHSKGHISSTYTQP